MTSLPDNGEAGALKTGALRGFSLAELLSVVAIVAILVSLAFPVVSFVNNSSKAARCVSHLRELGKGLAAYAGDHQGTLLPWIWTSPDPTDGIPNRWHARMTRLGYITNRDVFYCPAFAPYHYQGDVNLGMKWDKQNCHIYGLREWTPPGEPPGTSPTKTQPKKLSLLDQPSEFFILADSYSVSEKLQGYTLRAGGAKSNWLVHLRHRNLANALFADGHVAAKDAAYFRSIYTLQPNYTAATGFDVFPTETEEQN
ncbi:MAG TPA: prepilin-type N-terminal cleavage/methylation domain-containing protein [Chthoniobacteraceae bacterium]|nr:prepilin-type N-terminal cleavage/methylation domain-containing protein [Chthoniobacteraceae bacterium]